MFRSGFGPLQRALGQPIVVDNRSGAGGNIPSDLLAKARPDRYLLLVWWDALESHTEGFRKSPEYARWRELLHPFYDPFPVVEHTFPTDRLAPMLTRENPAALVRKDGALIGIVSRYDVLQQLIGTR